MAISSPRISSTSGSGRSTSPSQPETERYLNHVVDRFDLRRHMRFGASVTSAVFDEHAGRWTVTAGDGSEVSARYLIAATGVLSVPYMPEVPGREDFARRGVPHGPVAGDAGRFHGQARGGRSGPRRAACRSSLPSWTTSPPRPCSSGPPIGAHPLNNAAITTERASAAPGRLRAAAPVLNTSVHGFHHPPHDRSAFEDPEDERRRFYEQMWNSPGFTKLTSNYLDLLSNPDANAEWCDFIAAKIRAIVHDPATAERLIPKDQRFGEKRPPFVTGYFEAFNRPNVALVDLAETPHGAGDAHRHRDDEGLLRVRHHRVGDRASTSEPARCCAWASRAVTA